MFVERFVKVLPFYLADAVKKKQYCFLGAMSPSTGSTKAKDLILVATDSILLPRKFMQA